jgi:hypothetical protein
MDMIIHSSLESLGSIGRRKAGSIPSLTSIADYLILSLNTDSIQAQNDCKDRHASSPHHTAGNGGGLIVK